MPAFSIMMGARGPYNGDATTILHNGRNEFRSLLEHRAHTPWWATQCFEDLESMEMARGYHIHAIRTRHIRALATPVTAVPVKGNGHIRCKEAHAIRRDRGQLE